MATCMLIRDEGDCLFVFCTKLCGECETLSIAHNIDDYYLFEFKGNSRVCTQSNVTILP